jgi:cysteine desulfurase/selenocysteine lyase
MSEKNFRNDFAVFRNTDYVYLDTAATAQRPDAVINAGKRFYEEMNANPLRGLYELSIAATDAYEKARAAVKEFIGADSEKG